MNYKKHLCAALLALVPFTAFSQTTVNTPTAPAAAAADKSVPNAPAAIVQDEKQICDTLKKTLQGKLGIPVESVSVTPVKGVYEVVAQNEIMYSDATADHIIVGQLFETKTQRNLTAETKDRRQIAVFSDPNCSFCRKLEASLKEMKDVTIYTFLYPVIRPSSLAESQNIWCAKDKGAAWRARMLDGVQAPAKSANCDVSAIERNIALGSKLGVTGTPTVFVPSGQRAPGAVSIEYLENMLAKDKLSE